MEEFSENKFQTMVDEMTRFEEEIRMPYMPEMKINPMVSQPFVIGTNTFSQAQRKILQINDGVPPMFVPPQVIHGAPSNTLPGGIPPPPAPPLSAPPAGMTFPPRISVQYNQPIPPPPQPPAFVPSMMMRTEAAAATPPVSSASSASFPRRTTPTWPLKNPFRPPTPTKTEPEVISTPDTPPKVVVSATPKLYTPKVESIEEVNYNNYASRILIPEPPRPVSYEARFGNRKTKPEPSKYTPVTPVDIYSQSSNKKDKKKKKIIRVSGGQSWEDPTLNEWEDGDFRLFAGDLGNDVTDELLTRIFSKYPSFSKARVVRDKRTNKTKGYGFISFKDPQDFIKASKEMNGRYVGSRPIKLRKSTWKNRNIDTVKKKEKEKATLIALLTGKS